MDRVAAGGHGHAELLLDQAAEGRVVQELVDLVLDAVRGHHEERVLDRGLLRRALLGAGGDDRLGELGERVALAPERERLVPAERSPLHRVRPEVVEAHLDQGQDLDRDLGSREVVREVRVRVEQDVLRPDPVRGLDDLGDGLVDDVLDPVPVSLLDRGEDGQGLLHAVDEQGALLGDTGLLSCLVLHGVGMDQKKSHGLPRINRKNLCAHRV